MSLTSIWGAAPFRASSEPLQLDQGIGNINDNYLQIKLDFLVRRKSITNNYFIIYESFLIKI